MNRILKYQIPTEYNRKKISEFLKQQGYSKQLLTTIRHTNHSLFYGQETSVSSSSRLTTTLLTTSYPEIHMNHLIDLDISDILFVVIPETESPSAVTPISFQNFLIPPEIIYEDDDIYVINKPAGMPIQPSTSNPNNTLANAIAFYQKEKPFVYRCVNRLDKNTSGLTILAKNALAAGILYEAVKNREVKRTYYAFVEGICDDSGVITLPISREEANDISHSIRRYVDIDNGATAVTHYSLIDTYGSYSLIELSLETGRTHQIRVHMNAMGHPLLGDEIYNPNPGLKISRHALHAGKLQFIHPITKAPMSFEVTFPDDMKKLLRKE